jgi:hypothetical protein
VGVSPDDGGGKARGGKDNVEEAGEYSERQARMRWLSDERHAANEADSRLWAEREALGGLAAKRDVREDTIDRLSSAKEMAVRKRSGMRGDDNHWMPLHTSFHPPEMRQNRINKISNFFANKNAHFVSAVLKVVLQ